MTEFKREERYIVIKLSDLAKLSPDYEEYLFRKYLEYNNIPTRQCVVVEADWPIYEETWALVEKLENKELSPMHYTYQELIDLLVKKQQYIEALNKHITDLQKYMEPNIIPLLPDLPQEEP